MFFKKILNRISKKKIEVGDGCVIKNGVCFFPQRVKIGEYVYLGPNYYLNGKGGIEIKRGTIIGPNLVIWTVNHNYASDALVPYDEVDLLRKVTINECVWIGEGVKIYPGVNVGKGSILAMGSVITEDVPENCIVIGNPAKVVKELASYRLALIEKDKLYLKLSNGIKIDKIKK